MINEPKNHQEILLKDEEVIERLVKPIMIVQNHKSTNSNDTIIKTKSVPATVNTVRQDS